jgi:hypothetical protein
LKVVSDTSPIIAFSNLGKLHVLKALFGRITIPHAVYEELSEGKSVQLEDWIQVEVIKDQGLYKMLRSSLDHGESEAIILYLENEMDLFLVDDGEARKVAASFEITLTGTGGLLLLGKKKGLISSVRTEIDTLEREGAFRLSAAVKDILLREAKE